MYSSQNKTHMKNLIILLNALLFCGLIQGQCKSGTIVGETWSPSISPVCIDGDIFVASLVIEPGTTIEFLGPYRFEVTGTLNAIGTVSDSIFFTKADTALAWRGIFFNYSAPGSELAFCKIDSSGEHGVFLDHSGPIIRNCTVSDCWHTGDLNYVVVTRQGGGIYCKGDLVLTNCTVFRNLSRSDAYYAAAYSQGGGVYVEGHLILDNCNVADNKAITSTCYGTGHAHGGGVYVKGNLESYNTVVMNNSALGGGGSGGLCWGDGRGGGIYVDSIFHIENSIIAYNRSNGFTTHFGDGLYAEASSASIFTNSTVAYNINEGVRNSRDTVNFTNSIFYFNGASQLTGKIKVEYSDIQGGFTGTGNINFNPVFYSPTQLCIVPGSPCIDAGNPTSASNDLCIPPSNGGSRNDMGAHGGPNACDWISACFLVGFDTWSGVGSSSPEVFPNPFESELFIRTACEISTVEIYSLWGQLVKRFDVAPNIAVWDGKTDIGQEVANGIYLIHIKSKNLDRILKVVKLDY